ncbi:CLAVATA3/ESR (CLE)-related protein 27 [Prosopis cineraria]|uniref:CLAVATA3/ESR (CLE)-related protein 27 n=1 Tax=Prosopis cineraria TaxID=364024 RepID=UPI00240FA65A|nr:CLAVATA3/ESR (CLE)-related protein 27 [Prosopis cineraria]
MCFAGGKTLLHFSPLLLLLLSLLQIWVCCHPSCLLVGAIRIFPENVAAKVRLSHTQDDDDKNHFFQKYYFHGNTSGPTTNNNTTHKGFEETKRRVPSCPDPLHN